jgi:hypothetical protein
MIEYQRINKQNIFIILLLGAAGMVGGIGIPTNLSFQLPTITFNFQNLISPEFWQVLTFVGMCGLVVFVAFMVYLLMGVAGMGGRMI